ncbi:RNA polymerase sigma factor [Pseudonocardia lacus]|jgi:RNA polymerase sigma factor (sigma-70 family)|uniref:RNA polymerase sigma factor n=1 Tax=Pseudonocardia lacus TaxID=2835865 RepID=UPI001BDC32D4|nr:sigma-70 family RNA polymerase sigma factor [Pseudonocardia lacus]
MLWTERTTTELVAAARAGDQRAWTEIMARFGGLVRSVVGSFRLQDADTADAVQNTWLRAVERLDTVREPERLGGWLRTTARRECLALPALTRREVPDEILTDQIVESTPGPEAAFLDDEASRAVREAVDALSGRRRRLVDALFYEQHGDYSVVSRLTEMPVGSIGPTRARVLGALRTTLERTGFGPAGVEGGGPRVVPDRRGPRPRPVPLRPVPAAVPAPVPAAGRPLPLAVG